MALPLITVIVPVYKVEDYLERCVESIRNQTYQNLEVILVDDGSPDRCGEMCDELAAKDSRIQVIHKKNGGLSSARNAGIDMAKGEYIGFVDSDDWIEPDMYENLYRAAVEYDAQIVASGLQEDYPDGRVRHFDPEYPANSQVQVYSKLEALRICLENTKITFSACDKLFHRDIFRDIRMTEGILFEDMEMTPRCLELTQRVVYDPRPYYHYIMTEDSILRGNYSLRRMYSADIAWERAWHYAKAFPELFLDAMASYVGVAFHVIECSRGVEECQEKRRQIIQDLRSSVSKDVMPYLDMGNQLRLGAMKVHPAAYELFSLCLRAGVAAKRAIRSALHKE